LFCIGFLILYSSNMYGDEIYLCNKAVSKHCAKAKGCAISKKHLVFIKLNKFFVFNYLSSNKSKITT
ncbi:hypothetical protein L1Y58_06940, partial [Acinetobacter baumannii]|nr:hypothetical protein [Acinetobacter baumannii]